MDGPGRNNDLYAQPSEVSQSTCQTPSGIPLGWCLFQQFICFMPWTICSVTSFIVSSLVAFTHAFKSPIVRFYLFSNWLFVLAQCIVGNLDQWASWYWKNFISSGYSQRKWASLCFCIWRRVCWIQHWQWLGQNIRYLLYCKSQCKVLS